MGDGSYYTSSLEGEQVGGKTGGGGEGGGRNTGREGHKRVSEVEKKRGNGEDVSMGGT